MLLYHTLRKIFLFVLGSYHTINDLQVCSLWSRGEMSSPFFNKPTYLEPQLFNILLVLALGFPRSEFHRKGFLGSGSGFSIFSGHKVHATHLLINNCPEIGVLS